MAKEPTMEGIFWKTLLVVGALSASGHCAPSQKVLTYAEAVEQGVVNYNSKAKEDSLYRLLEAVPRPEWDPNSEGTQELSFSIKETACPAKEEGSLDKCDFKEGGVVRECTATYFLGEKPPMAVLDCKAKEGIEEEEKEVEQKEEEKENQEEEKALGRSKKLIRKLKRKLRRKGVRVDIKVIFNVNININIKLNRFTG